jgi:hypothetical protein
VESDTREPHRLQQSKEDSVQTGSFCAAAALSENGEAPLLARSDPNRKRPHRHMRAASCRIALRGVELLVWFDRLVNCPFRGRPTHLAAC